MVWIPLKCDFLFFVGTFSISTIYRQGKRKRNFRCHQHQEHTIVLECRWWNAIFMATPLFASFVTHTNWKENKIIYYGKWDGITQTQNVQSKWNKFSSRSGKVISFVAYIHTPSTKHSSEIKSMGTTNEPASQPANKKRNKRESERKICGRSRSRWFVVRRCNSTCKCVRPNDSDDKTTREPKWNPCAWHDTIKHINMKAFTFYYVCFK